MNPRTRTLAAALVGVLAAAQAWAAADPAVLATERRALDVAVASGSTDAILASCGRLSAASAADPDDAAWHYWTAVATWRAVPLVMRDDKKRAEKLCKDGITHAERLVKLDEKHAEGWAVLAGLQGLSLSFSGPMAGMTLGPKMEEEMQRAASLAPTNPRVQLMAGINTLHKPGFVGGGPEKALPVLTKAQELFAAESVADSTAPAWGRDDAYLWAGRAQMKLKRYADARASYTKALEANPDNAWVRTILLPAAEKALADGKSASR